MLVFRNSSFFSRTLCQSCHTHLFNNHPPPTKHSAEFFTCPPARRLHSAANPQLSGASCKQRPHVQVTEDDVTIEFKTVTIDQFKSLAADSATSVRIEEILWEYEYKKYTTVQVPSSLSQEDMRLLLSAADADERSRLLVMLHRREVNRLKKEIERRRRSEIYWSEKRQKWQSIRSDGSGLFAEDGQIVYGLWHNSLTTKFFFNQVKKLAASRMRSASMFGNKLIVDWTREASMSIIESNRLMRNAAALHATNKYKTREPFDLHFTGVSQRVVDNLDKHLANWMKPSAFLTLHRDSFVDAFADQRRQRLVYITPHAKQAYVYQPDDWLVIPGLTNHFHKHQELVAAIDGLGVRQARVPFDEHVLFSSRHVRLDVNLIASLLRDYLNTECWSTALNNNQWLAEFIRRPGDVDSDSALDRVCRRMLDEAGR